MWDWYYIIDEWIFILFMFKRTIVSACIYSVYFFSKADTDKRLSLLFFDSLLEWGYTNKRTDCNASKRGPRSWVEQVVALSIKE